MKIRLVCIGRTAYPPLREAIERYASRIPHYIPFELRELPDVKTSKNMSPERQKELEGRLLLDTVGASDFLLLLDERGRELTSRELASFIQEKMITLPATLVLAIGGPYGFSPEVYARAHQKLSLSKMTFPHEMVRLFITEQLYRAMTILRGEPYHHD